VTVAGVWFVHERHVVILLDSASQLAVPIFIGPSEALSIELRLDGRRFERPLTHDLYDATLERLGGAVERVTIDRLQEDTFHATVVIRTSADRFALDARSSDAIALALGAQAPIEVADAVVRRAGVDLAALEAHSHGELAPREPRAPEEVPLGL
jgi:bifunctional DNase/RNase